MSNDPHDSPCRWFSRSELACKGSGLLRLHPGFALRLDALREALGRPMVLTSACRSELHNRRVGGAPNSFHICDVAARPGQAGCLAVDVRVRDRQEAAALVRAALDLGWSVGVPSDSKGFIHCDARDLLNLPQAVFGY